MTEVLAQVQEQMSDIAAVQRRQAELKATGESADGMVKVTVNAHGQLVETVIDESYLDEYEFEELSGHITEAAQTAAREAARRVAEMMAPITERRMALPSMSEIVEGAPDLRDFTPPWRDSFGVAEPRKDTDDRDGGDDTTLPTVRR
jgi:DNA-binding protein YbaB